MSNNTQSKRFNTGRWVVWGLFALTLAVAPSVFSGGLAITVLSQMGIASLHACPTTCCWVRVGCSVLGMLFTQV